MTEWKEYKLGEIATFSYGKLPNKILLGKGPYVVYSGYKYLEHYPEYNCNVGDVILVARGVGGTGDVKLVNRKCFLTNLSIKIDLDNDVILNEYFYYIYQIENLRYLDSGSAQSQITIQDLSNVAISLPPLSEQTRIASILSSLDDKIDLLHRENKTLEAMAETLFRQWFIEEAKEDWKEVSLEYVCERITDGSHYSPESVESGLPMASVKDMEDWGINLNSCRKISKEEFDKLVSADCLPQVNDILIAKDGSYLKHIFVVNKMQEVVILSSIAIIRPNGLYHPYLLSLLLKLDSIKEELKNIVTGAVIPRIVLKDFRKFPIILPPKEKQEKALLFIEPIMKKCFYNREQIQTLIQQRDSLLPKLMSGEVKI